MGYLLRAFLERLGLHPESPQLRIIATSASIEQNPESIRYLEQFFGRDGNSFRIIAGERESFPSGGTSLASHSHALAQLKADLDNPERRGSGGCEFGFGSECCSY